MKENKKMKKAFALTLVVLALAGCGKAVPVTLTAQTMTQTVKAASPTSMNSMEVPVSVLAYANDYVKRMSAKYPTRTLEFYADVVASRDNFKTSFVSTGNSAGFSPKSGCSFFSNRFKLFSESTHNGLAVTPGSYRYYLRVSVHEPYAAHQASFLNEPRFFVSDYGKNFEGTIEAR